MKHVIGTMLAGIALSTIAFAQAQPMTEKEERAKIAEISKLQKTAKASYLKQKSNRKLKKSYIDWTFTLGENYNFAKFVPSREKYPKALGYFREVLKADPKHEGAKKWSEMIVSIYKSMGKPVPNTDGA